jgi:hypothetical protein
MSWIASFAGNIEVATLPCCGVFPTNLLRCGCQFVSFLDQRSL